MTPAFRTTPGWIAALASGAVSGATLGVLFPTFGWDWLAWVALAPLFITTARAQSPWQALTAGYVAGVMFFGLSCPWITHALHVYGDLSGTMTSVAWVLFLLLMGSYIALFAVAAHVLGRRLGHTLIPLPFLWVAVEWLRTYTPMGGFPWNLLGYSQHEHAGFMLSTTVGGVYAASFLICVANTLIVSLALRFYDAGRKPQGRLPAVPATMEATALLLVMAFATLPYHPPSISSTTLRARLVQPDTPMDASWSAASMQAFLARQIELSAPPPSPDRNPTDPDILIWPEQPAPLYYELDPRFQQATVELQQRTHSEFLFEEIWLPTGTRGEPDEAHPRNAARLVHADGTTGARYDKIHLVPFGEYDPLPGWIQHMAGVGKLTEQVGDFVPGRRTVVFQMGQYRFATLICYESIFPQLVRENVNEGAQFLVNLSNDGWYGDSSAAAQGLAMAQVRAMENRRWLLRATNDGVTAVIDPYGRVTGSLPRKQIAALDAGFSALDGLTFYTRHGDWLPQGCFVMILLMAATTLVVRRPTQPSETEPHAH